MTEASQLQILNSALRKSEDRFQAIFNQAAVGIAHVSLSGHWLLINQKICDILGYSFKELRRLTVHQVSHPDEAALHLPQIQRLLAGEIHSYNTEKRYIHREGYIVWVNLTVTLVRDRDGAPQYFIAVVQDINERKRVEEALQESEERFRLMADAAPVIIWEAGADARLTFLNKAGLDYTGRTLQQELGDGWMQGVHPEDLDHCIATYLSAFHERRNFALEYRLHRADGEYGWVAETGVPRLDKNGNLTGYLGTCVDITDQKRIRGELQQANLLLAQRVAERTAELSDTVERLQDEITERIGMGAALHAETTERLTVQAELRDKELLLIHQNRLAAMGEMIGNIAHQWRQPLNLLGLLAQDLTMTYKIGDFSQEYLSLQVRKILDTVDHMSQTIDDFRNFFRPFKQKVDFKVLEIVKKTICLLEGNLKAHQITTEVKSNGDPVVNGYPNEFSQVLVNIMVNARDALVAQEVASPKISIEIGMEGERTVLTITDNAGGIPEEVLSKIFDPYFTTKGPDQGTGVGLFLSKTIIEKNMGGTLSASNVGPGAQFRIVI